MINRILVLVAAVILAFHSTPSQADCLENPLFEQLSRWSNTAVDLSIDEDDIFTISESEYLFSWNESYTEFAFVRFHPPHSGNAVALSYETMPDARFAIQLHALFRGTRDDIGNAAQYLQSAEGAELVETFADTENDESDRPVIFVGMERPQRVSIVMRFAMIFPDVAQFCDMSAIDVFREIGRRSLNIGGLMSDVAVEFNLNQEPWE